MIDRQHDLSITQQARLLGISRSSVYYLPRPVSETDLALMRCLDELHLDHPFMGARMLRDQLHRQGIQVGRKHITTLMLRMGIAALAPQPGTSKRAPGRKIATTNQVARPFVVASILDHKLHFVLRRQSLQIRPMHPLSHPTSRTFYVEHHADSPVDPGSIDGTARLQQHLKPFVTEPGEQRTRLRLTEWLPSGHLDQGTPEGTHLLDHIVLRQISAAIERIGRVTPGAPKRASGQTNEHAGSARMGGFALDAMEDFRHFEHA